MGRTGGGVFNVTAKSGTNDYHGRGFYQTRPVWGQTINYFSEKEGGTKETTGVSDSYLGCMAAASAVPSSEIASVLLGRHRRVSIVDHARTCNIWPTARQRSGDFSRTTFGGAPVRLFNPGVEAASPAQCPATGTGSIATGGEFTGAMIPRTPRGQHRRCQQ